MAYYDKVLEDYDEAFDSNESYDEGIFSRKRPIRVPASLGRNANFGRNVANSPSHGNYVTKSELKNSLNSISDQVNDLKKANLSLLNSIKSLDGRYENVIKSIAKKDKAQDSNMASSAMMPLLSTLINRPTFDPTTLVITDKDGKPPVSTTPMAELKVGLDAAKDNPIQVDLTKTLLFSMMPSMMSSGGGGNNNMMMMLMFVLVLGDGSLGGKGGSSDSGKIMLPLMMMMMMGGMDKK